MAICSMKPRLAAADSPTERQKSPATGRPATGQGATGRPPMQLLIAHKDAAARAALARAIGVARDGGLEVVESAVGTEALELLLEDDAPRLAVVDWDMPGLDGPELCRLVRDFHLGGPPYIVLLAAGPHHPDVESALEAGANDCIRTPAPSRRDPRARRRRPPLRRSPLGAGRTRCAARGRACARPGRRRLGSAGEP